MPSPPEFDEDDDGVSVSDSDEDYNEQILLNKVRNQQQDLSDIDDEVYGVGADDDEEEQSDLALSDVEDQDDDLPDLRAWGKDKRKFYSTDYIDKDFNAVDEKDAELAELEEEDARRFHDQLVVQMDDDDAFMNTVTKKLDEKRAKDVNATDTSKSSKKRKLKDSPELFGLKEDFKAKQVIIDNYLDPVLHKYNMGKLTNCPAIEFVSTHRQLIANYMTNIHMYLLLRVSQQKLQSHPIMKRLHQYRQLLSHLEPIFDDIIKPQIEMLLQDVETEEKPTVPKKTLKILKKLGEKKSKKKKVQEERNDEEPPTKKVKFVDIPAESHHSDDDLDDIEENASGDGKVQAEDDNEAAEPDKRAITYEMAKNKGLTPYRKKEQRNPRVRHRNKFRKAKIRRKGAVREPRTEMTRYGGEISGIKTSVVKSVKIQH